MWAKEVEGAVPLLSAVSPAACLGDTSLMISEAKGELLGDGDATVPLSSNKRLSRNDTVFLSIVQQGFGKSKQEEWLGLIDSRLLANVKQTAGAFPATNSTRA